MEWKLKSRGRKIIFASCKEKYFLNHSINQKSVEGKRKKGKKASLCVQKQIIKRTKNGFQLREKRESEREMWVLKKFDWKNSWKIFFFLFFSPPPHFLSFTFAVCGEAFSAVRHRSIMSWNNVSSELYRLDSNNLRDNAGWAFFYYFLAYFSRPKKKFFNSFFIFSFASLPCLMTNVLLCNRAQAPHKVICYTFTLARWLSESSSINR